MINVTIWNESGKLGAYPTGMNDVLATIFPTDKYTVRKAQLKDAEQGLPQSVLDTTDVLLWWGHCHHDKVGDELVQRIVQRVHDGMGIVFLHSAHFSKPFKALLGTHCSLHWRENASVRERLWTTAPHHPIAQGIPQGYRLRHEEMYGEPFDIPTPDDVVFTGWYNGGEVFRSGVTFTRGQGRIFYFQPGHETFPIYYDEVIRRIILNAVIWCTHHEDELPDTYQPNADAPWTPPMEGWLLKRKAK